MRREWGTDHVRLIVCCSEDDDSEFVESNKLIDDAATIGAVSANKGLTSNEYIAPLSSAPLRRSRKKDR